MDLVTIQRLKDQKPLSQEELRRVAHLVGVSPTLHSVYLTKEQLVSTIPEGDNSMPKTQLLDLARQQGIKVTKRVPHYRQALILSKMKAKYCDTLRAAEYASASNLSKWFGKDEELVAILNIPPDEMTVSLQNYLKQIEYPDQELIDALLTESDTVLQSLFAAREIIQYQTDRIPIAVPPSLGSRMRRKIIHNVCNVFGLHSSTMYNVDRVKQFRGGEMIERAHHDKTGVIMSRVPLYLSRTKRHRKFRAPYIQRIFRSEIQRIINSTEKTQIHTKLQEFKTDFYASL